MPIECGDESPALSKGFGPASSWKDVPFVAAPSMQDEVLWRERVLTEVAAADAQGADSSQGLVIVLAQEGKVVERRIGVPDWRPFLVRLRPERFDTAEVRRVERR